jgi:hypothetical protein
VEVEAIAGGGWENRWEYNKQVQKYMYSELLNNKVR